MVPAKRRGWWIAGGAVVVAAVALLVARRSAAASEIERLAAALELRSGSRVADVGAGKGRLAFALARRVGPRGHVYATEIDPERLRQMRDAIGRGELRNVTVVEAGETETGLDPACCDAAYLRDVYHHLSDPGAIDDDLFRAIAPGGRLIVIDFEPGWFLSRFFPVEGVPEDRGGHGVAPDTVVAELEAAGFELERRVEDWGLGTFAVVFRRPDGDVPR